MRNEGALRAFLWSVIAALLVIIGWLSFAYQRPGGLRSALAPVVDTVDSMLSRIPGMPNVTLTEPTTVLFMGVDVAYSGARAGLVRDNTSFKGNTDTMLLGFLNPQVKRASILHIPRDTEAYVGKAGIQKINSANAIGGPELARATVADLLGVPVNHYLIMNLHGLVDMVNEIGGVTVEVPKKMSYMDWTAKLKIDLEPGVHTLTGNQAMGFVRFRHDALGDIGRVQRQQVFLQAVARKMAEPASWVHVPALLQIAQRNINTDMNEIELISALNFMHSLPREAIKFVMLPGQFSGNGDWIATTDGRDLAQQLANPDHEFVLSRRNISVCVINATSERNLGGKVATALQRLGYLTRVERDDPDPLHRKTQIIVQNGNTANAKMLQHDLGDVGEVVNASVGNLVSSITIVAHNDLNLNNIKLSSADMPYVAQTTPPPIVVRSVPIRTRTTAVTEVPTGTDTGVNSQVPQTDTEPWNTKSRAFDDMQIPAGEQPALAEPINPPGSGSAQASSPVRPAPSAPPPGINDGSSSNSNSDLNSPSRSSTVPLPGVSGNARSMGSSSEAKRHADPAPAPESQNVLVVPESLPAPGE